jgi:ABC-type transporter Mla subunit MlaD
MKRIIAALTNKIEKLKLDRKVNRVNRAIETAKDNARDTIDRLNEEASKLLSDLAESSEVNGIITKISDKLGIIEEQEEIIKRLDKVKEFIEEDVEVEEEKD